MTKRWTMPERHRFEAMLKAGASHKDIAAALGREVKSVRSYAARNLYRSANPEWRKNDRQSDRNALIIERRNAGASFAEIGREFGISAPRAFAIYYRDRPTTEAAA